jgi:outer membrane receptor protein involved in Fe transport
VKADQTIFQPKGSIVVTPFEDYELYVSAGRGFHSNDVRGIATGGDFLTSSEGEEIGLRATPFQQLHITVTLFQMTFKSELTYDPDVGQTSAGPPSRRTGIEINPTYTPFEWLEFYGSIALTHARFSEPFDDGTGHVGRYIPDAPSVIGNLGIYLHNLGQWFGAVEFRYLGEHPLTPDDVIKSSGDKEWNMNVGYDFGAGIKAQLEIVNVLDSKDDAAEYWYADRLPGEPAEGVADLHVHPLEPRSFRFTVSKTF